MPIIVNGTTLNNVDVGGANIQKVYARQGETGTYVLVFSKEVLLPKYAFGGNWKMNMSIAEIDTFFEQFNLTQNSDKRAIIFAPACYLDYCKTKIPTSLSNMVDIGIQRVSIYEKGAYTGQISVGMAEDCGCKHALVGHSENRQYDGVTNQMCNEMLKTIFKSSSMVAWLCVGETLEIRKAGNAETYVQNQLDECLADIYASNLEHLVVCYEPIWSIGTGVTASPDQAEEMASVVREKLASMYGIEAAEKIPIVYGGAINVTTAPELMAKIDIDGTLAGGISLKGTQFAQMINEVLV